VGLLIEGKWHDQWYDTKATGGGYERKPSSFRDRILAESGAKFPAEANRYHLYVSLACPWAHRTLIFRKLLGLEEIISLSVVDSYMGADGWFFSEEPGSSIDSVNQKQFLREIYLLADPNFTGRVTVPVLWDRETGTIVNNESSEIIRMLNSEFGEFTGDVDDFYPEALREEIDAINDFVYPRINNGVYRCGFATSQSSYEEAFHELFGALDILESRLAGQKYLIGDSITEADWRLFTTLVRFDAVYVGHFKCNLRRIADYPNLSNYLKRLYRFAGVAETVNFAHIKRHYYGSHSGINPTGVVPVGPVLDFA
jgi:putative glutathione S-transferase